MFPFARKRKERKKYQTEVGISYNNESDKVAADAEPERDQNPNPDNNKVELEQKIETDSEQNELTVSGKVKSLRERFASMSETRLADLTELRRSLQLSQSENPSEFINKGIVKSKAEEFKKRTLIKSVTDKPPDKHKTGLESSGLHGRSNSDGTINALPVDVIYKDQDLDTWDVIDVRDDDELREVQKSLDKMPKMSRERSTSIMKQTGLYQDFPKPNVAAPEEHENSRSMNSQHSLSSSSANSSASFSNSSSLSTSSAETRKKSEATSEYALQAIPEESFNASLPTPKDTPSEIIRRPRREGLWQHQQNVIDSGILEKLSSSEIKLQEALFEMITSEESNLKSLEILVKHFKAAFEENSDDPKLRVRKVSSNDVEVDSTKQKQSTKKQSLGKYEANKLFFNVEMIKECSEKFLAKVEEMQKEEVIIVNFLDMVSENAGALFGKAVVKYCKNMNHQNEILKHLLENEIWFAAKTRQLEKDPILNDKTFKSFLVVPLSRICHIPLLLEKIVKVSKHLTDDYSVEIQKSAVQALALMKGIAQQCNKETQQLDDLAEQQNMLISIQGKLVFKEIKMISLVTQSRRFYFESSVIHVTPTKGRSLFKNVETNLYLFLFTDMIIITKPVQNNYEVLDIAEVNETHVQEKTEEKAESFKHLSSSHNAKGPICLVFFRTKLGSSGGFKKSSYDVRMNPNCFQDHAQFFIFPTIATKEQFLKKLKEAQVQFQKMKSEEASNETNFAVRASVVRRQSTKAQSNVDRRKSSYETNRMLRNATSSEDFSVDEKKLALSDDGDQNEAKMVTKTSNLAFTPLLNLKRYNSSIQLSNSNQLSCSSDEEEESEIRPRTTTNTPIGCLDDDEGEYLSGDDPQMFSDASHHSHDTDEESHSVDAESDSCDL